MSDDVIERAAEAVRREWGSRLCPGIGETADKKCHRQGGSYQCACEQSARASLEEFSEPTRKMASDGAFHLITHAGAAGEHEIGQAIRVYRAMVKRALMDHFDKKQAADDERHRPVR